MKNYLLSLLVIITFATSISSCKKDTQESQSIIGRWEKTNNISTAWEDGKLLNEENEVSYPGELVLEFKADNSISVTQDGILSSEVTTYSINGNVITINNTYDGIKPYKFIITNNNTTLTLFQTEVSIGILIEYKTIFKKL